MASVNSRAAGKQALPPNLASRLAWQTRRAARRTGIAAMAGMVCLAAALLAHWHGARLEQRQQALALQLAAAARAAAQPAMPLATPSSGVDAFYAYLPPHDTIPDQLKELVRVAQGSGITLAKAEYKPEQDGKAGFLRYQIALPVRADYARLQRFIVDALQTLPTLTLESVTFKREQIDTGEVEARIQFVLLVRRQEGRR